MSLQWFVEHFGYLAVLIGGFLEGETMVLLGGLAAHRGYLELRTVIAVATTGTLFGNQLYFQLGRTRGAAMLERKPAWRPRAERVLELARRHQTLVVLAYRFVLGVRTVTPFVLGMSGVSRTRFTLLDVISTVAWALAVGGTGYVLGSTLESLLPQVRRYEFAVFAFVACLGGLVWGIRRWRATP
jgi:membrane protein DedA with SNARE-associated domain